MLLQKLNVKVADFGLAKCLPNAAPLKVRLHEPMIAGMLIVKPRLFVALLPLSHQIPSMLNIHRYPFAPRNRNTSAPASALYIPFTLYLTMQPAERIPSITFSWAPDL